MNGKVFLIGAGPGDPGLFTLKGKSILERADVVVYDRLVSPAILGMCNPNAQMVDVGKMPTHHKVKQSEINKLLVKFAQENPGATIARLKGGDPFVFGRGGEECLELVEAGVRFEVVPGITAGISVPAYAGIPVTHRGIATSLHIITGHEKEECPECNPQNVIAGECNTPNVIVNERHPDNVIAGERNTLNVIARERSDRGNLSTISGLDFPALAKCPGTLVFYMGISNMEMIARRLMECGKDPKTPLAFIEKGTTPYQRTVTCTLETAGETIVRENVVAPAITIMGDVVELGQTLAWRKNLPLSGKRLVVTRAAKQASGIATKLKFLGAEVIETPMIATKTVAPYCHCERSEAIESDQAKILVDFNELSHYDVLAFTSTNGVDSFFESLFNAGLDIRVLAGKKIASVGKITENRLLERGIRCDYVPEDHTGEGLGKLLASVVRSASSSVDESRILLLQGNLADETLTTLLPKVTRWIVYETLPVTSMPDWKREAIATADAVVFASSSAVENFANCMELEAVNPTFEQDVSKQSIAFAKASLVSRLSFPVPRICFSIGRLTTATAKKYGFEVIESEETSMKSLVNKIGEYFDQ